MFVQFPYGHICFLFGEICTKFRCVPYIELSTWENAGTFKAKYAVNAENFQCNIMSVVLCNEFDFNGLVNERAFKQCIATEGLVFVRQSL